MKGSTSLGAVAASETPTSTAPAGRRVAYLCGSPRVSTRPETEAAGPRAHVVGVMRAFSSLGWDVRPFIVGDRMPESWTRSGSERLMTRSRVRALAADVVRLALRAASRRQAWSAVGRDVDWVYERYAAFQDLGLPFRRRGIPWILETNGPFFHEAATDRKSMVLTRLAKRKEAKAYRESDVVVCISEALKQIIVERIGVSPEKIVVIPNGVDVSVFDPSRFAERAPHGWLQIGFVGHLIEWQGLEPLIRAIAGIRAEGADVRLTVTGDGPMLEPWARLATGLGIAGAVEFTGRVPATEVPSRIAAFDLGFSSTSPSGLGDNYRSPLKLYEYMAMARPVLSSRCEDSARAVSDARTGFLFEAGDARSLEASIRRAWDTRERLPEMGRQARAEIVAGHSWEARVADLIRAVDEIVGRR